MVLGAQGGEEKARQRLGSNSDYMSSLRRCQRRWRRPARRGGTAAGSSPGWHDLRRGGRIRGSSAQIRAAWTWGRPRLELLRGDGCTRRGGSPRSAVPPSSPETSLLRRLTWREARGLLPLDDAAVCYDLEVAPGSGDCSSQGQWRRKMSRRWLGFRNLF